MRRALGVLSVIALAVTIESAAATRGDTGRPVLRVVDATPLVIRGVGFKAHEQVKLVVTTSRQVSARTRAGVRGTFVVRLTAVDVNACFGFSIVATGDLGSRAVLKRAPGQCPAP